MNYSVPRRRAALPVVAAAVAMLAACGKSGDAGAPPAGQAGGAAPARQAESAQRDRGASAQRNQGASAEQVAKAARGDLSCPPKIATPARAATAPVDDVLGVRAGLGYDEAMASVLCSGARLVAAPAQGRGFSLRLPNPAPVIRQGFTARDAQARVVKSGREIVKEMQDEAMARGMNRVREDLAPGQSKWFVATMGPPGQERVLAAAREERFAEGQNPTVHSVLEAMIDKYGRPTHRLLPPSAPQPMLRWAYDPAGVPIAAGSPLYMRCTGTSDPDGGVDVTPDCGVVVQAMLFPLRTNADLVDRMQVGVVDKAGGWRMIGETERAVADSDRQRRAAEVSKAAKSAKGPSL